MSNNAGQPMWKYLYEKFNMLPQQAAGVLQLDPFHTMAEQARTSEEPPAIVTVTASTASDDYSKQRITVTVSAPCPSTEAHVSFLTEAAFLTARRLLNEGADSVGLPRLG